MFHSLTKQETPTQYLLRIALTNEDAAVDPTDDMDVYAMPEEKRCTLCKQNLENARIPKVRKGDFADFLRNVWRPVPMT